MFIRKRTYASKRGPTESYQVIESYRDGGKVKQRRICNLGWSSTPEDALAIARKHLASAENSRPHNRRSLKLIRQDEEKRLKDIERLRARVSLLESVVSRMGTIGDNLDTTKGAA